MDDNMLTNLHQKVFNGEVTQKEAAKIAFMSESKLKAHWNRLELPLKRIGRHL